MVDQAFKEISNNCINCNRCYESCIMLQELGPDFKDILLNDKLKDGLNKCTLCGLCTAVCPQQLDICNYYALLKQAKLHPLVLKYFKKQHRKKIIKSDD